MTAGLCALALLPGALTGQQADPLTRARDPGTQPWMTAWSPLSTLTESDRRLPSSPELPGLLDAPAPRVGQTWSAGNAAALARDLDDAWGEIRLWRATESGGFRRPLDSDGIRVFQLSALRWQRLGERGAVAGRVVADETTADLGSYSPAVVRHSADPFVVTDTTTPPMRHVRARVEGAYGWSGGPWGWGFAVGLEISDDRSRAARSPRLGRSSTPGVTAGVVRQLPLGELSVSTWVRWVGGNENIRFVAPEGIIALIRPLQGYADPEPVQLSRGIFGRNVERDVGAFGVGLAGEAAGVRWAALAEREDVEHRHTRRRLAEEPPDRWVADRWRIGGSAVGHLGPVRTTVSGEYVRLDGDAFRKDLVGQGSVFRAEEERLSLLVDARVAARDSSWMAGLRLNTVRESRLRRDFVVATGSEIESWKPALAVEVARRLGAVTALSVAAGLAFHDPTATLPDPGTLGPIYQELVAPELSLYTIEARPMTGAVTLRHELPDGPALFLNATFEDLRPSSTTPVPVSGERRIWRIGLMARWSSGSR